MLSIVCNSFALLALGSFTLRVGSTPALPSSGQQIDWNTPYPAARGDRPEWSYLNSEEWYINDPTQQDHARLHAYLSMSIYGNFKQDCPKTFTKGFHVISEFSQGYAAYVPEMMKVVLVFRGVEDLNSLDWTPAPVPEFLPKCPNCRVAKGVKDLYLHAKQETNNFAEARRWVKDKNMLFSATGLGIGGAVAGVACLDLGNANLVHYCHNQGTPRFMNYAAVDVYDTLFQALAGQSLVARNDPLVHAIPFGIYCHVGQKAHLTGEKTQWLRNCFGNNEDPKCLGSGDNLDDHKYYFTSMGTCGAADKGF